MIRSAFLAGICLSCPVVLPADPALCARANCAYDFQLASVSETKSYGLLMAAPRTGCGHVRFRVETAAHGFLGRTPPLAPGEVAVVRMGPGFAEGVHALTIMAEGCSTAPSLVRRVTLDKPSPDHGVRSSGNGG